MAGVTWVAMTALAVTLAPIQASPDDRLYGRVTTAAGDVFEGYIRWDRNEGSWVDLLSGSKELPWENARDAERLGPADGRDRSSRHSIDILGLRISWTDDDDEDRFPRSATSGIRFGHIRTLEVRGRNRASLVLKSGEEIEFEDGSTDLGDDLRELLVDDADRGEVSLRWRDLERVDFMPVPRMAPEPRAARLYGTLRTRAGDTFTGFVSWDVDEILTTDVLDGEERGRDRKIPFGSIAAIERNGSSGARVRLRNGEEVVLRDSNDVDDDNRGIGISDPGLGQVLIEWDEFDSIDFGPVPAGVGGYDAFDGGEALYGTVETEGGERLTGWIRWDNDEEYSWEILDGRYRDLDMDIEFGLIEGIRKRASWGAEVRLRDGRVFELEDSNDVDEGNKGVYVLLEDGDLVRVDWWDFREVAFAHR